MNELEFERAVQERQQALLQEAEQRRLVRSSMTYRPPQLAAWLRRWADALEARRRQAAQPCTAGCERGS